MALPIIKGNYFFMRSLITSTNSTICDINLMMTGFIIFLTLIMEYSKKLKMILSHLKVLKCIPSL